MTEKKEYVKAASEVVLFNNTDAITTSGCTSKDQMIDSYVCDSNAGDWV